MPAIDRLSCASSIAAEDRSGGVQVQVALLGVCKLSWLRHARWPQPPWACRVRSRSTFWSLRLHTVWVPTPAAGPAEPPAARARPAAAARPNRAHAVATLRRACAGRRVG
eukprot:355706-Chlamydomonas_euryale.AAC.3